MAMSICVAELNIANEMFSNLVKRADDAMYYPKDHSRNKVIKKQTTFIQQ
jgi:PleD family two-component response regulator